MMTDETITLYVYREHCGHKAARVCRPTPDEVDDDIALWGEGSENQLLARAAGELARRSDMPSHHRYRWACARNVAAYLGHLTRWDATAGRYVIED